MFWCIKIGSNDPKSCYRHLLPTIQPATIPSKAEATKDPTTNNPAPVFSLYFGLKCWHSNLLLNRRTLPAAPLECCTSSPKNPPPPRSLSTFVLNFFFVVKVPSLILSSHSFFLPPMLYKMSLPNYPLFEAILIPCDQSNMGNIKLIGIAVKLNALSFMHED